MIINSEFSRQTYTWWKVKVNCETGGTGKYDRKTVTNKAVSNFIHGLVDCISQDR